MHHKFSTIIIFFFFNLILFPFINIFINFLNNFFFSYFLWPIQPPRLATSHHPMHFWIYYSLKIFSVFFFFVNLNYENEQKKKSNSQMRLFFVCIPKKCIRVCVKIYFFAVCSPHATAITPLKFISYSIFAIFGE